MDDLEELEEDDFTNDFDKSDFINESKNNTLKYDKKNIIIAILIIIIVILTFMLLKKGNCKKCDVTNDTKTEEKSEEKDENENVELSDSTKELIANKLAALFSDPNYEYGNLIQNNYLDNYSANVFEDKLDNKAKALLIIRSLNSKSNNLNIDDVKFSKDELKEELLNQESISTYESVEFIDKYMEVFGVKPKLEDIDISCPSYYYEENSEVFVENNNCKSNASLNTYIYIDEIFKEDDNIIVNTYVGAHRSSTRGEYYYDDYEYPSVKNNYTEETTISSENKSSFTNYKFIFEKENDGEYYFKKVEKIN